MTKLLVTPLHVAPAAALLVSSIQVASPGCDIVPGEALAAGLSVPPAGLWSVELVSHPRSHLSLSTDTSWEGRGASEKSRFTADTTQTWGPQEPRRLGEGGRPDREQGLSSAAAAAWAPPRRACVHHAAFPHQHPPGGPRWTTWARGSEELQPSAVFSPQAVSDWGPPMLCSEAPQVPWFLLGFHFPTDKAKFTS